MLSVNQYASKQMSQKGAADKTPQIRVLRTYSDNGIPAGLDYSRNSICQMSVLCTDDSLFVCHNKWLIYSSMNH